jgi:hypothetical protein
VPRPYSFQVVLPLQSDPTVPPPGGPGPRNVQDELARNLPKIWIGYLLCLATFVDEAIVLSEHPEIASGQLFVPPLHLFLLSFVSIVYWLVSVHRLHVVLSLVPGWTHPISPARAAWFHFIPVYSIYWLYRWPKEAGRFVNWRLRATAIEPRKAGIFVLLSYIASLLLGPGGLILLFFSLSYVVSWVGRALVAPLPLPPENGESAGQ